MKTQFPRWLQDNIRFKKRQEAKNNNNNLMLRDKIPIIWV